MFGRSGAGWVRYISVTSEVLPERIGGGKAFISYRVTCDDARFSQSGLAEAWRRERIGEARASSADV